MPTFRVALTIVVETALSVGAGGSMGTLADKSLLRDGWRRPILPGSQVKGRLRHTCEELARGLQIPICQSPATATMCPQDASIPEVNRQRCCLICQIFGSPGYRGVLTFRDLVYEPDLQEPAECEKMYREVESLRPGIGVERRRGVVQEGLLFLIETSAPGTEPRFRHTAAIEGDLPGREHALLVLLGLRKILNWGGGKSRGLGWSVVEYQAEYDDQPFDLDDSAGKEALKRLCASK